jgi:DNA-binding CsgD family transcriptional regulator/PAS domain-containing protein
MNAPSRIVSEEHAALVSALVEGASDPSPWSDFLARLRAATGADFTVLNLRQPGRPYEEVLALQSGLPEGSIESAYRQHLAPNDLMVRTAHVEGRPYSLEELLAPPGEQPPDVYRKFLEARGISALRQVRVREPSGVEAWLTIGRNGPDFDAADDALLSFLAGVLRSAIRQYVAVERERFDASTLSEAARRLQFGWFTLDSKGQILDSDPQVSRLFELSSVIQRSASDRLIIPSAETERAVFRALERIAASPASRAFAITLSRDPWLDMLLMPANRKSISTKVRPTAIVYVHGDSWQSLECCEQLAEMFRLTPNEARLALALCRGMTIAEAAREYRIAVGTARNQTKAIYAKTGARGLPDLVRIIMRSVLAIASQG